MPPPTSRASNLLKLALIGIVVMVAQRMFRRQAQRVISGTADPST